MTKELEALDFIQDEPRFSSDAKYRNAISLIRSVLIEKEDIDSAKPSEALECWKKIDYKVKYECSCVGDDDLEHLTTIKQALIKAQEQEKVLEALKSKARFYDNNTKCKIEIEADDFNSSKEWEQVKEVLK